MNPKDLSMPRVRAKCPVCREPVYSRAGVHPQCAVKREDSAQAKALVPPPAPAPTPEPAKV